MSIRVIIADDHKIVRQGLAKLLEGEKDIEIVGEAGDGQSVMQLAREKSPNVIIMDLAMPHMNGIEATRQITKTSPMTKILALSMYLDRHYVAGVLGAGASGYLLKDCAVEELVNGVRTVNRGEVYLSQKVSGIIVKYYVQSRSTLDTTNCILSPRERQVLQLLAEGMTAKETAAMLGITTKTAEKTRQQIMEKLDLHSAAELTKFAIREGLTTLDS